MDKGSLQGVVQWFRKAVHPPGATGLTDADLLRAWVVNRDEAAFETLLWRHFAAVLGVCWRILGDLHEAEDAAQATFLTLARKARSIGRHQAVAAWLFTVAHRVALRARAGRKRRPCPDSDNLDVLPAAPGQDPAWSEVRPILDEEVNRLPMKYRAAFVLCHIEGRTNEEAAREMGCPVGTIHSRLAHARQRLRTRLAQRGVTLTAGALISALAVEGSAVSAGMLVRATVRAAALTAAGKGLACAVSTEVAALTEGVIRAMLLTKVKVGIAVVLGTALLFGGGTALSYRIVAGEAGQVAKEPESQGPGRRTVSGEEEKLKALLAEKEKEIRDLKDRLANLEVTLRRYTSSATEKTKQNPFGASGMGQRKRDSDLSGPGMPGPGAGGTGPTPKEEVGPQPRAGGAGGFPGMMSGMPALTMNSPSPQLPVVDIEQARDEVELLEAKVATKKAIVKEAEFTGVSLLVRQAELKEAEVLLAQAKRRLQKLAGAEKPARGQVDPVRAQKLLDLENQLDAVKQGIEALRLEMKSKGSPRR